MARCWCGPVGLSGVDRDEGFFSQVFVWSFKATNCWQWSFFFFFSGICSGPSRQPSSSRQLCWTGSRLGCRCVAKVTTCWTSSSIARISTTCIWTTTSTSSPSRSATKDVWTGDLPVIQLLFMPCLGSIVISVVQGSFQVKTVSESLRMAHMPSTLSFLIFPGVAFRQLEFCFGGTVELLWGVASHLVTKQWLKQKLCSCRVNCMEFVSTYCSWRAWKIIDFSAWSTMMVIKSGWSPGETSQMACYMRDHFPPHVL